jgi:hypothetical protein
MGKDLITPTLKLGTIAVILIAVFTILMTGCADVSHIEKCLPVAEHTYGFWGGLWHGIVAPFALIGEMFSDDIAIYAHNNNGGWYDFGFVLGIGGLSFGGSKSSRRK